MPRRTNPKTPTPRDMAIFDRALVRGERQTALAREYGLSKQRVNRICGRVGKLVFQELTEDFSDHRRRTLLRLDHVYSEALDAWQKSKAGRCSETLTTNQAGGVVRSRTRQRAAGDVRYLAEARQALADMRDLCGLDATKTEVVELRQSKTYTVDFEAMSDEELEKIAAIAQLEQDGLIHFVEQADPRGEGAAIDCAPPRLLEQASTQLL